ncbi:ATP-binding protein [Streptomyces sp. NPDC055722]
MISTPSATLGLVYRWTDHTLNPTGEVRAVLRRVLKDLGLSGNVIGDGALAVSELVANAHEHACGPYEVRLKGDFLLSRARLTRRGEIQFSDDCSRSSAGFSFNCAQLVGKGYVHQHRMTSATRLKRDVFLATIGTLARRRCCLGDADRRVCGRPTTRMIRFPATCGTCLGGQPVAGRLWTT